MQEHSILLEDFVGLCAQDPFIYATVYIFVVLGSFPVVMLTTANYKIKTYSWKMFLHLAEIFLMFLSLGFLTHFGLLGILAYSVNDIICLCIWNKPIFKTPYAKYIGSMTIHHALVFLVLLLLPLLIDCTSCYYYAMINIVRNCTRYLFMFSYLSNKQHWKSQSISIVTLVLIVFTEVVYISMTWWTINYLVAIVAATFVLIDIELNVAVYRSIKKFSPSNGKNEKDLEAPDESPSSRLVDSGY